MKPCVSAAAPADWPVASDEQKPSRPETAMEHDEETRGCSSSSVRLQGYGVSGAGSLMDSMRQREMSGSAFFMFSLDGVNTDDPLAGNVSPLAALCPAGQYSKESQHWFWKVLSNTSSWGMTACGSVSYSSWADPKSVRCIEGQLRLGAFLGIHAVVVPLPDFDEEDPQCSEKLKAAALVISKHLQHSQTTNVWVRCDASRQADRVAFSRLRTFVLWGGENPPTAEEAPHRVVRPAPYRIVAFLNFSETFGAIPSEWFGESVAAFELPNAEKLRRALSASDCGRHMKLPSDLMPLKDSYWGTAQPMFVSLATFVVELLRRRAAPVFAMEEFVDSYQLLNTLYEMHVADGGRDKFFDYEDVLQLPLQPLGHMLASGVYEVFEQDRTKYQQYHTAMSKYFNEWLNHSESRSHEKMWLQGPNPRDGCGCSAMGSVYVVLLGAGRGPLISECLCAATGVGVRVHLFVVEKNPEALELVRLRVRADPQWHDWMNYSGHVVETIYADGRSVWSGEAPGSDDRLPPYWGLCDLVVSELLGSFGDNELSPECLDDFYCNLLSYQESSGIPCNPYLTSIPQQYTAWIAPLHSARMEESVATAAFGGLTTPPADCHDRHAALYHSMFVSNVCRAVGLCLPQPCWTFHHFATKVQSKEREATLNFTLSGDGRFSGFICYFSAVLFTPGDTGNVEDSIALLCASAGSLSTVQYGRTTGLFSWFPAFLPVEPRDVVEVKCGDELSIHLKRCVDVKKGRVWYEYEASILVKGHPDGKFMKRLTKTMNAGGWAGHISLLT
ncbi:arginine N-methyltransferase, type II [Trypanosoma equiperdum]|uniref:Arginine N-methyltransferase, type II n=1 Tax=Trypanosoma equiperdum TaxID=5694 RepID=A0A1G4IHG8_TRYEQ|nr:arginine N-methyltransferase, type II [Trypanosoma equiperdum]